VTHNIFQTLLDFGHDEDFIPRPNGLFTPTEASPGSMEKIEVLRTRVQFGLPLWHPEDNPICSVANRCTSRSDYAGRMVKQFPKRGGKGCKSEF